MPWFLWHFYLIKELFAFFLRLTWVHVSLYPLSGFSWDICQKSLVKQQENMSLTSVFILETFFLDDVWPLLGETRSWSLLCLGKFSFASCLVFVYAINYQCCFSFYCQRFEYLLESLFSLLLYFHFHMFFLCLSRSFHFVI